MTDRIERRPSERSIRTVNSGASGNTDVFSDDFAVDGDSPVADGFRPVHTFTRDAPRPTTPPRSSKPPPDESKADVAKRIGLSTGSGSTARNSFTLQHDAQDTPSRMSSMHQSDLSRRISSVSSTSTAIPRTQSPFVGASAPSHPYGMYPQDTQLNRSSTTSTIRPSRPTHPYGMYSQGTGTESEAAAGDIANVGFPGLSHSYARRLGPDGEEADDIIGPDGHTEQLPPYSRYPEGIPPKERVMGAIEETSPLSPESTSLPAVFGAATAPSERTNLTTGSDESTLVASEKELEKEGWVQKSKRRFFGLPLWAIIFLVFLIVIIAAVSGGVIGRILGNQQAEHENKDDKTAEAAQDSGSWKFATSSMTDVVFPTPTEIVVIPTGVFGVPLFDTRKSSSRCLSNNLVQSQTWLCPIQSMLSVNVSGSTGNPEIIMRAALPPQGPRVLTLGPQLPEIGPVQHMGLARDLNEDDLGQAYYFCAEYEKRVLFPEEAITPPAPPSPGPSPPPNKRSPGIKRSGAEQNNKNPVLRDTRVWSCHWPGTYLEGFIYTETNPNTTARSLSGLLEGPDDSSTENAYPQLRLRSGGEDDDDADDDDDDEDEEETSTTPPPTGTTTTPAVSSSSPSIYTSPPAPTESNIPPSSSSPTSDQSTPTAAPHFDGNGSHDSEERSWEWLSAHQYPRVIKIEETRGEPDTEQPPHCQLMYVNDDCELESLPTPTSFTIIEEFPHETAPPRKRNSRVDVRDMLRQYLDRRQDDGQSCQCEWIIN